MRHTVNKSAAIRAVMKKAGRPLMLDDLIPLLEEKLRQVIGRARLYRLLSVMIANDGDIETAGRGRERTYALKGAA